MHSRSEVRASVGLLLVAVAACGLAWSCGGDSDSEVAAGGTGPGAAGSGPSGGGSGNAGTGNSADGGGGDAPEGGGGGGTDPTPGECEARESWTEALHYVLAVTWPGTTAGEEGEGQIDIWSRVSYTANGDDLEIGLHACGSVLPETALTLAGRIATGGEKVLIEVPGEVWDAPSVPTTMASGKHTGFDTGSDFEFSYVSMLGVTLPDPQATWPDSGAELEVFDLEEDGNDGYTAAPRNGGGYVLPPTAVGLAGSAPSADKVYLVSRQAMTLKGKRTSCDEHAGTANVTAFDNHVVGCHIKGGAECTANQTDFVDQNRMRYAVKSATYEAKLIADDATCAEVRAALPE